MGSTIQRPSAARNVDENAADAVVVGGVVIAAERTDSRSGIWRRFSLKTSKQKLSSISASTSHSQFTDDNHDPDANYYSKGYVNQVRLFIYSIF